MWYNRRARVAFFWPASLDWLKLQKFFHFYTIYLLWFLIVPLLWLKLMRRSRVLVALGKIDQFRTFKNFHLPSPSVTLLLTGGVVKITSLLYYLRRRCRAFLVGWSNANTKANDSHSANLRKNNVALNVVIGTIFSGESTLKRKNYRKINDLRAGALPSVSAWFLSTFRKSMGNYRAILYRSYNIKDYSRIFPVFSI